MVAFFFANLNELIPSTFVSIDCFAFWFQAMSFDKNKGVDCVGPMVVHILYSVDLFT
jgi:hypothetical protein